MTVLLELANINANLKSSLGKRNYNPTNFKKNVIRKFLLSSQKLLNCLGKKDSS